MGVCVICERVLEGRGWMGEGVETRFHCIIT